MMSNAKGTWRKRLGLAAAFVVVVAANVGVLGYRASRDARSPATGTSGSTAASRAGNVPPPVVSDHTDDIVYYHLRTTEDEMCPEESSTFINTERARLEGRYGRCWLKRTDADEKGYCIFIQCGDAKKLDWGFCSSRALCVDMQLTAASMALDAQREAAHHLQ